MDGAEKYECDYEIAGYFVKWQEKGAETRKAFYDIESAIGFARKIAGTENKVSIVQERNVIGW